jgi:hypothetical protein
VYIEKFLIIGTSAILILNLISCGYSVARPSSVDSDRKIYYFPTRKYTSFPPYNRLLTVLSPGPIPEDDLLKTRVAPVLQPELSLNVENRNLEEVAKQLAATVGYNYYCASAIASLKISTTQKGSIDTIVADLANRYNFTAIVNHEEGRISFFSGAWRE